MSDRPRIPDAQTRARSVTRLRDVVQRMDDSLEISQQIKSAS